MKLILNPRAAIAALVLAFTVGANASAQVAKGLVDPNTCLLYTSPSPRD